MKFASKTVYESFIQAGCSQNAALAVVDERLNARTLNSLSTSTIASFLDKRIKSVKRRRGITQGLLASQIDCNHELSGEALRDTMYAYRDALREGVEAASIESQKQVDDANKGIPSHLERALVDALSNLPEEPLLAAQLVQGGKRENDIRDLIAERLLRAHDTIHVGKEIVLDGKRVDLVLEDKAGAQLVIEAKVAFGGAVGSPGYKAPGLTCLKKGLMGDIRKVKPLNFASRTGYLLIVPHFAGERLALVELADRAPCYRKAILEQSKSKDWPKLCRDRVEVEVSKIGGHVGWDKYVRLGQHNEVDTDLQFIWIIVPNQTPR